MSEEYHRGHCSRTEGKQVNQRFDESGKGQSRENSEQMRAPSKTVQGADRNSGMAVSMWGNLMRRVRGDSSVKVQVNVLL